MSRRLSSSFGYWWVTTSSVQRAVRVNDLPLTLLYSTATSSRFGSFLGQLVRDDAIVISFCRLCFSTIILNLQSLGNLWPTQKQWDVEYSDYSFFKRAFTRKFVEYKTFIPHKYIYSYRRINCMQQIILGQLLKINSFNNLKTFWISFGDKLETFSLPFINTNKIVLLCLMYLKCREVSQSSAKSNI